MAKLSARSCETAKPDPNSKDRPLGDGDGLFLRIRPNVTKTWTVEFTFQSRRRKFVIGTYDAAGATGQSISAWLAHGRLSLAQARAIAGHRKADRHAGHDPVAELEARLAKNRAEEEAAR